MLNAKISNLDPVQVTGYRLPEPDHSLYFGQYGAMYNEKEYRRKMKDYEASKFIADVENVEKIKGSPVYSIKDIGNIELMFPAELQLNQSCFIEPTLEGKCVIVKL